MKACFVRFYVLIVLATYSLGSALGSESLVEIRRLPDGAMQPQVVVDGRGVVHVVYLAGDLRASDVFYVSSKDWGRSFSQPRRVNSLAGSATAAGAIRGAQIAVGRGGRVHVAWNGSSKAKPRGPLNPEMPADSPHNGTPMLYSRLGDDGSFERQRNLMTRTFALDGGGSLAADQKGNVYVAWHGKKKGSAKGEAGRRVWLARSTDGGATFSEEQPAFKEPTGACGCCGMRIFADSNGRLLGLYRSARDVVHRDIYLLASNDHGKSFTGKMLHPWEIGACPMTSMSFSETAHDLLAAWETEQQVYFAKIDRGSTQAGVPISAPGKGHNRKYPALAQDGDGRVLLTWVDLRSRGKPGALQWTLFDSDHNVIESSDDAGTVPAWSFAAAFAGPDGKFVTLF